MAGPSIAMAELVGTIIHSTLYGIYVVLFVGSLYIPFRRRSRGRRGVPVPVNKILITVTLTLFVLITIHWIIQLTRLTDAFIFHINDEGGPNAYYGYPANIKNVLKTAFYVVQTFVGDFTMVYRLYIVWGREWKVVILPALTSFGLLIAGSGVVYSFDHLTTGENIFVSSTGHWVLTVFATSLATNGIVTVLIAYRIWTIHRQVKAVAQTSSIMRVVHIILESAGMYTLVLVLTLIGYLTKNNYQFTTLDATSPTIGIAFTLIIVRVGLGLSSDNTTVAAVSTVRYNVNVPSHATARSSTTDHTLSDLNPNVRVNISKEVLREDEREGVSTDHLSKSQVDRQRKKGIQAAHSDRETDWNSAV
ncbi:hypothetical protein BDQ17DRAFT_1360043 [Cyathus striatus]|nr:hypothetical protein BDQ17DRAFT_1360043 [Cyathus striatus]